MINNVNDLKNVYVYDDTEDSRDDCSDLITEIGPEGIPVKTPEAYINQIIEKLDNYEGLFCDYHLQKHKYASFNGDQIVANAYKAQKPAVLCTSFTDFDASMSRSLRRFIPTILLPSDLGDIDKIAQGFNVAIRELKGDFTKERKPWKSLIRVSEIDTDKQCTYVIIPSWDDVPKIKVPWSDFPPDMLEDAKKEDFRFHAKVNMGNENPDLLYIDEFER